MSSYVECFRKVAPDYTVTTPIRPRLGAITGYYGFWIFIVRTLNNNIIGDWYQIYACLLFPTPYMRRRFLDAMWLLSILL